MSKAPSMPMYWDAYLADTTHLSTEEHGAYMLLLGAMWRRNGWVPDDDSDNARILGMTKAKWRKTKARLSAFLIFDNDEISQKKLLEIWKNTQEKIAINRVNGAKGGRPKSNDTNDLDKANGFVSDNPNETIPEPEPYKKEDTNVSLSLDMPDDTQIAFDEFNELARLIGLPIAKVLSKKRKTGIKARMAEAGGIYGWRAALGKVRDSPLCTGDNQRGWVADLDFILQQSSFTRLMEGSYDKRDKKPSSPNGGGRSQDGQRADPALEKALRLSGLSEAQGNAGG